MSPSSRAFSGAPAFPVRAPAASRPARRAAGSGPSLISASVFHAPQLLHWPYHFT